MRRRTSTGWWAPACACVPTRCARSACSTRATSCTARRSTWAAACAQRFHTSKLAYAAKWHGRGVALALRTYLILEYLLRAAEESLKLAMGSRREERQARLRVIGLGLRGALGL